jgi:hypothetical protein
MSEDEIKAQKIMDTAREKLSANLSIGITSLIFICYGIAYLLRDLQVTF